MISCDVAFRFKPGAAEFLRQGWEFPDATAICLEAVEAGGHVISTCQRGRKAAVRQSTVGATLLTYCYAAIAGLPIYVRHPELRAPLVDLLTRVSVLTPNQTIAGSDMVRMIADGPVPWTVRRIGTSRRQRPSPLALDQGHSGFLLAPADRITKAAVESLAPGAMRQGVTAQDLRRFGIPTGAPTFYAAYLWTGNERKAINGVGTIRGVMGLPREPEGAVWKLLTENGALVVKAHLAMWARAYAETDAAPGAWISLPISRFCDDLNYKRGKHGAHQLKNRQAAMSIAKLLTSVELYCVYVHPTTRNGKTKTSVIHGPLWSRGLTYQDGYADLFGRVQEGDPDLWDPVAFSFAPGPWYAHPEWRRYNRNVALVGMGLLALDANHDRWAILVGGYVATLARFGGYAPRTIRVQTLLRKTGLGRATDGRPSYGRKLLTRALDRIRDVDCPVIAGWEWVSPGGSLDADDPEGDDLSTTERDPGSRDWRSWSVRVFWPQDLAEREERLRQARRDALAAQDDRTSAALLEARKAEE